MKGLVMHNKAINMWGKHKSILKKNEKKHIFFNNLNICYPLNIVFELGISVYNHAPLKCPCISEKNKICVKK